MFGKNKPPIAEQQTDYSSDLLIDVRQMSKIYNEGKENEVRALDNISLTVPWGEFLCILGQSGSGKSTPTSILGRPDIPTYGTYYLNGQAVSDMKPSVLSGIRNREIGFIFQGFNLIRRVDSAGKRGAAADLPRPWTGGATPARGGCADIGRAGKTHVTPSGGNVRRPAAACCDCAGCCGKAADHHGGRANRQSGFRLRPGYHAEAYRAQRAGYVHYPYHAR